jgi:predicted ATPase
MFFEDAHGTDPSSLELLGRIAARLGGLRMLLIVTFRPEFEPPWIGRPHVTVLTLNRLAEREIRAMIDGVVGNKLLPVGMRQDIIDRADGMPLFVEEMTKAVRCVSVAANGHLMLTLTLKAGPICKFSSLFSEST